MRILGILPATLVAAALVAGCSGQPTAPATGAAAATDAATRIVTISLPSGQLTMTECSFGSR